MSDTKRIKVSEEVKTIDDYNVINYKTFILPNWTRQTFGIRTKRHFTHVFALTPDNKVIINKQFRPGPEDYFFETPGGYLNEWEEPIVWASRELLEETWYTWDFIQIAKRYMSPYQDATHNIFFATNCKKISDQKLDEWEDGLEVILVDLKDIWEIIHWNNCLQREILYKCLDYIYDFQSKC